MLCATDLSPRSSRVVTRAVLMANQVEAALILLHVIDPDEDRATLAAASSRIELQLQSARPAPRRKPAILLHVGERVPTIATVASETGADLIVIGSQPGRPLEPLIAATAGELAAQTRRPVLIVKRNSRAPYASVLIAADLPAGFNQALRIATTLRLLESESVTIIHGFESPYRGPHYASGFDLQASRRNIEQWEHAARRGVLDRLGVAGVKADDFRLVFAPSRPIRQIQREVRKVAPDLLVIASKDRSLIERVMRGSTGNDALRNNGCDILLAPMG
jgi:nucleotide-binding universal stress UspA family protein